MPHIAIMHYCNYNPWKGLASSRCPGEVNNDAQHDNSHLRSTRVIWDCSGTPMEWSVFFGGAVSCTINSHFSVQLFFTHGFDPGCLDPSGGIVILLLPWTFLGNHIYIVLHNSLDPSTTSAHLFNSLWHNLKINPWHSRDIELLHYCSCSEGPPSQWPRVWGKVWAKYTMMQHDYNSSCAECGYKLCGKSWLKSHMVSEHLVQLCCERPIWEDCGPLWPQYSSHCGHYARIVEMIRIECLQV